MSRTIVIGDIHGALKALDQIITSVAPKKHDRIIFLGDYVDGWSESAKVIEYLIHLDQTHNCIFLKGNHDAWCEQWLNGEPADREWLFHGGKSTVDSYVSLSLEKRVAQLDFFNRMRNYYV